MPQFLKIVRLLCTQSYFKSPKSHFMVNGSLHTVQFLRFYRTGSAVNSINGEFFCEKKFVAIRKEAQAALLYYLHQTRCLQFLDAENMSKNSPEFLERLLKRVGVDNGVDEDDVGHSMARFFRYHPINEFEPFFESIGLKPCEYASFLPRNFIFLSDQQLLLHNYHVLCNYGIARNRIGKVYMEASEVFMYDYGILQSKLVCFQNMGLQQSFFIKVIASSPCFLKGGVSREFLEFSEKLKNAGIGYDWLEDHMPEGYSYNWKSMLELICLLGELGLTGEDLGKVITNHPDLLLDRSGEFSFYFIGGLLKFGSTQSDLHTVFLQFPHLSVVNFTNNLWRCYNFLIEIRMPVEDIGRIFRSYSLLLGSCKLKKVSSLLISLNRGLTRLSQMVKDDPYVLKRWALGVRVDRIQEPGRVLKVRMMKIKFLLSIGFVEKSKKMERALKLFCGKGEELQERFDCLVNTGLSRDDVISMVKVSPLIMNQTKDVIKRKIGFLVKDLGYPLSDVAAHPGIIVYAIKRVQVRLLMYEWLKDEEALDRELSLGTLVACSEKLFLRKYVNSHPGGPEFWENLKRKIYSICT